MSKVFSILKWEKGGCILFYIGFFTFSGGFIAALIIYGQHLYNAVYEAIPH